MAFGKPDGILSCFCGERKARGPARRGWLCPGGMGKDAGASRRLSRGGAQRSSGGCSPAEAGVEAEDEGGGAGLVKKNRGTQGEERVPSVGESLCFEIQKWSKGRVGGGEGEAWTSSHVGVEVAVLTRRDSDVPEPLVCPVLLLLVV